MHGLVKIHGLNALYYVVEGPEKSDDWEFIEGGTVEIPSDIADWPNGTEYPPPRTLAVSQSDPKRFREFRHPEEIEQAGYEPTGLMYGGVYSPRQWERLVKMIPSLRAFESLTDNDPPGVMDEALANIQGAR